MNEQAVEELLPSAEGIGQLSFLVGGLWVAEGASSGGGFTLEERCCWGPGERFILTEVGRHAAGGVVATARGFFGWDSAARRLRVWSFASDGSYLEGREVGSRVPESWPFIVRVSGPRAGELRITLTRLGEDRMRIAQEALRQGRYLPAGSLVYTRRPGG